MASSRKRVKPTNSDDEMDHKEGSGGEGKRSPWMIGVTLLMVGIALIFLFISNSGPHGGSYFALTEGEALRDSFTGGDRRPPGFRPDVPVGGGDASLSNQRSDSADALDSAQHERRMREASERVDGDRQGVNPPASPHGSDPNSKETKEDAAVVRAATEQAVPVCSEGLAVSSEGLWRLALGAAVPRGEVRKDGKVQFRLSAYEKKRKGPTRFL